MIVLPRILVASPLDEYRLDNSGRFLENLLDLRLQIAHVVVCEGLLHLVHVIANLLLL